MKRDERDEEGEDSGVADRRALSIKGRHSRTKLKIRKGEIFSEIA